MKLQILQLLHDPSFQHWLEATVVAILLAVFVILKVSQALQKQAEDEEFREYFERLDDAEKRRGL
jgi:hypothetical protein